MTHNEHRMEAFEEYYGVAPAVVVARVLRHLRSKGLQAADAENVTQETMVSLIVQLSKPAREEIRDWVGFVLNIANKRFMDFHRDSARTPLPKEDIDRLSDTAHFDDTSAIDENTRAIALDVYAKLDLSPQRRRIADMLWNPLDLAFDAVPQAYVAKELNIKLGTVKSTLSAIKKQFYAALRKRLGS